MKPQLGDVYRSGSTGPRFDGADGTFYWLVVAVHDTPHRRSVQLLGLDKNWNVVSSSSRGAHAMDYRRRCFTIKGFKSVIEGIEAACKAGDDEVPF